MITQIYPDIIIDDFEEENINDEIKLRKIIELLESKKNEIPKLLFDRLIFLFEQAILCKTGVYFYF